MGVFRKASVHCRRDQLWKSLHDGDCDYGRFSELLAFVHTEQIRAPLLRKRGKPWFKSLMKLLSTKYAKTHRYLRNAETEHLVILSENYVDMALVVTMELHKGHADFIVINRYAEVGNSLNLIKSASYEIAENLFNEVCFHLWHDQF